MVLSRLLIALKGSPLGYRFLNRRVATIRFGVARGFKRIGGLGILGLLRRETKETRFVRSLELNGQIVFDLGANFGAFTMYFCRAVGPSGHVYAFDPILANCASVEDNLSLNNLTNATVLPKAVGAQPGEVAFTLDPGNTATATGNPQIGTAIGKSTHAQTLTVAQVALDDLVDRGELQIPDLVKIDVEGMEAAVLAGMRGLLEQRAPDLYIEMHGATANEKLDMAQQVCTIVWDTDYNIYHVERDAEVTKNSIENACSGHLYCTPVAKDNSIWRRTLS